MLQPLAAITAAIKTATRKYFGLVILILLVHGIQRGAGVDAKAAGDLDRSGAKAIWYIFVLGDGCEQAAGLGLLALLDHGEGGHLAGRSEPRLSRFGQR